MSPTLLVIYFWLRNFIPVFVAGILVALFVWLPYKNSITEIGAVCFLIAGAVSGIIIAEKDRKENKAASGPPGTEQQERPTDTKTK